ncbi:MAG: BREX-1 system adenine-specific DNA-methyltransferase PglX [Gemmatimonadetes bacterium]|nr:BREX-1 system adenine-specific DNA-methyltransferase PglX [Gemmatimonadota bacterium]
MAQRDPAILAHLEWLGFVQPTGLVVSAPALVRAGAILDRRDSEGQRLLRECVEQREFDRRDGRVPWIPDFERFARAVLGWGFSPKAYAGTVENPLPSTLEIVLHDYGETLRADYAVRELEPEDHESEWQLLIRVLEPGQSLDEAVRGNGRLEASPHVRMERLLRGTGVTAGLLFNGRALRLISAPYGESSGWLDFHVADMLQTAGRPISTALRLLLSEQRLLALPRAQRLPALLEESRRFQNEVSERLAEQVLHALYELLRGFQGAHDASNGQLLRDPLSERPDDVYRALLTVILRLVFLLYAEERDMLPEDETFLRCYSLAGLHERLREDAALYPDTMDLRYGAWAQLLALFRMVHDGAASGPMLLPRRHGVLFDPDRFPFLEGRASPGGRQVGERIDVPLVPDGTVYRALEKLLVLDGERISYRALDVEQLGSVYETMMGFRLERATGRSVAIRAQKKHGAPTAIDLEALLDEPGNRREKWIRDQADRKLSLTLKRAVNDAGTVDDLHAALAPVIDRAASPDLVPRGAIVLQPSEERRRSGSHYTPRLLTEPIVRTTLEPILRRLRGEENHPPRPEQILDLKVCDPAMGSGAFLVEACRQLGDALIEAWHYHGEAPAIPPDEDEVIHARRLVAQRCLYGVDRNPVAVDLSKVSLWLATLARDHAFTFLDHALRHGDSLVGLTRRQIEAFHWDASKPRFQAGLEAMHVLDHVEKAAALRRRIRAAGEDVGDWELRDLWDEAQHELSQVRLFGDLVVAAFFEGSTNAQREAKRGEYADAVLSGQAESHRRWLEEWRHADQPLVPFHWAIEFPEVFERNAPGFAAIVGNPPFAGHVALIGANLKGYTDWLKHIHVTTAGKTDLVAHFFRRAFNLIREGGAFGLIATNTVAQGDTRATGLRWICTHGGEICNAQRRFKWPGMAAVVVSIVHVFRGRYDGTRELDGRPVDRITAFLFHGGGHEDPARLAANAGKSFQGSIVLGMGFTFDDTDNRGVATPLAEMHRLIEKDPRNAERIFPYIGGEEVNTSPTHAHHRYVINYGEMSEEGARCWPDLMAIVEEKVKPERLASARRSRSTHGRRAQVWWQHYHQAHELYAAIAGLERLLVIPQTSNVQALAFLPTGMVLGHTLIIFPLSTYAALAVLQSRFHQVWSAFLGPTMKDDLRYAASDCFETFPFPENWDSDPALEAAGNEYYEFRAALMVRNNEGLTQTYNRFHDPDERNRDILKLRELHAAMDRAVLDAYGWIDITTGCDFFLDYEIDEEEWGNRKKPWRYRWPDDVRDEVLARLLELNAERAAEEARSGGAAKKRRQGGRGKPVRHTRGSTAGDLFS